MCGTKTKELKEDRVSYRVVKPFSIKDLVMRDDVCKKAKIKLIEDCIEIEAVRYL